MRNLGHGSSAVVDLIYYISEEKLYALKIPYCETIDKIERERKNYLKAKYPFMSRYYGYIEVNHQKCLFIEYIEGKTLDEYDIHNLDDREKFDIAFEILITVQYFHSLNCICRDLFPNNIIINKNMDAIMIDFDRLTTIDEQYTLDFYHPNTPPEISTGNKNLTFKSDVYSLGFILNYIFF